MKKSKFTKSVGGLRTKYQKGINDVYIWSALAIEALGSALNNDELLDARTFSVPSKKPAKMVSRSREQVEHILGGAKEKELYRSVFSHLVAQVEAFLLEILELALWYDEKKLKTRVQGVDHVRKIDVNEIIDRRTRKELIGVLIEKELTALFYAAPAIQFQYIEEVLAINLDDDVKNSWREIKASRDLMVHNSSRINKIYLKKAGADARGTEGDELPLDAEYINSSIATMKALIGRTCSKVQAQTKSKGQASS